jgi:hypothetical protein
MLKLVFVDDCGDFVMRRYEHDRRGVVELLVRENLIVIRPGFGGPLPPAEVEVFHKKTSRQRLR